MVKCIIFFGIMFYTVFIYIRGEQIHLKIVQLLTELVHYMRVQPPVFRVPRLAGSWLVGLGGRARLLLLRRQVREVLGLSRRDLMARPD